MPRFLRKKAGTPPFETEKSEPEILFGVLVADAADDCAERVHIGGILAAVDEGAEQVAEDAAAVKLSSWFSGENGFTIGI